MPARADAAASSEAHRARALRQWILLVRVRDRAIEDCRAPAAAPMAGEETPRSCAAAASRATRLRVVLEVRLGALRGRAVVVALLGGP